MSRPPVSSPEYQLWQMIKGKCYNPSNKQFRNNGAKGIEVCDEWFYSFESFIDDMGRKPSADHALYRIDLSQDWQLDNCRWEVKASKVRRRVSKLKCTGCKERFEKEGMIKLPAGNFHSIECATRYSQHSVQRSRDKQLAKTNRDDKKSHTKAKKRLNDNDRSFQIKKTQHIFNKYIRLRDRDLPCISCNRLHDGQYHAGHYRTVGGNPELRFDPRNCYKQCAPCNNHLSGNLVKYRINLVAIFGMSLIGYLEGPHELKRYTIDDLKLIQAEYGAKVKVLELSLL